MRILPLSLLSTLAACTGSAGEDTGSSDVIDWSYPLDDTLRLTDAQVIGTHNSTHLRPDPLLSEEWDYAHQPLAVQLGELGVRQLELDVWWNEETEEVDVMHVPIVDGESTCPTLAGCLDEMLTWSEANPAHYPVIVLFEPKDELPDATLKGRLELLDEALAAGWPAERTWTPDDQQGSHASLRDSVVDEGWPLLEELRGKAIFVLLDGSDGLEEYIGPERTVAGRPLFPLVGADDPLAAVFLEDSPEQDHDSIGELVDQGFLVRTRSDAGGAPEDGDTSRLDLALSSGAHCISTDFPEPDEETGYVAAIPGGKPVGCNPRTAPAECTPEALEDPAFMQ